MKKIVGTIAAIALAASSAFAGVGIGSWGRAIWAPVQGDGDKVTSWEGISWGGAKSRVGISVHGESENVGFINFHILYNRTISTIIKCSTEKPLI